MLFSLIFLKNVIINYVFNTLLCKSCSLFFIFAKLKLMQTQETDVTDKNQKQSPDMLEKTFCGYCAF